MTFECPLCGAANDEEAGDMCQIGCPIPEGKFPSSMDSVRVFVVIEWHAHEGGDYLTTKSSLAKALEFVKTEIRGRKNSELGIKWMGVINSDWGYHIIEQALDGPTIATYDQTGKKVS